MKSSVSGDTERTIEVELSADELLKSSQASASPLEAQQPLHRPRALAWSRRRTTLALGVALAVLLVGIAKQRNSKPAGQPHNPPTMLARATAAQVSLSTSSSKPLPVRIANPFDATEVFEFPPGTSLEYAREAVAEFLLDRARDRHARHAQRSRNRRELRNS